jgi:peptidoglycan hydrolase-like protein with peptidoglycan-binding domain
MVPLAEATGLALPENQVAQVQAALQQRKYYHGRVDGIFGPATEAAIRAYQLDRSLRVTGKIDATLLSDLGL